MAVGRIPARTIADADSVMNKLIRYQSEKTGGAWENKITWIADDGDYNLHLQDAESIVTNLQTKTSFWDQRTSPSDDERDAAKPHGFEYSS